MSRSIAIAPTPIGSSRFNANKSMDFTIVDLTGFSDQSIADIQQYVDSLPQAAQAKILRIGF